ncbi:MAG: adenylosuccinate synthase, partial [Rhodothermales bacterium]
MKTDVVIGAAYGDEGKGRTVCDLATADSVVVRFNGGAQAGHTVYWNGTRHVFSHFGAGTLKGCETVLAREFGCHPRLFNHEWAELAAFQPRVLVDPNCRLTTVFDVLINLMAERARGDGRHGSVGIGFGETIEREEQGWALRAGELINLSDAMLAKRLIDIRENWLPARCVALGFDPQDAYIGGRFADTLKAQSTIDASVSEFREFQSRIRITSYAFDAQHLIFEGAQGLMLDMEIGDFPHVTRSCCGLKYVRQLTDRELSVHYVTRAYSTRHGAGPFAAELPGAPYPGVQDRTNIYNESQEGLRFSYLNLDTLRYTIATDIANYGDTGMQIHGVMTCLDQVPEQAQIIQ